MSLSEKQISYCLHLIKCASDLEEDIQDWYDQQAQHNALYQNENANYKDAIIADKIKESDHSMISELISDLKIIAFEEDYSQDLVDSILERLERL